jgi:hypothetical protein
MFKLLNRLEMKGGTVTGIRILFLRLAYID